MYKLSEHAKNQILNRFSTAEFKEVFIALQDKSKFKLLKITPRKNLPDKMLYKIPLQKVDILVSVSKDDTILSLWRCGEDGTGENINS